MKILLSTLLILVSISVSAQKFAITGRVVDTLNSPLPAASVLLLNVSDSSLLNFGSTNAEGFFEIRNINRGSYLFKITFVGFASFTKRINSPDSGNVLNLGQLKLQPASQELSAIDIEADRAPVTIKKDTIEFNAGSFKTNQNAVVEDLLKKLPGIEVDNDGNITAQGERVKSVTVDGKNFFGTDPKIASKNLPADAVEKVQVFDKKSDQATFTGIDDGQREKSINLALKPEKRNSLFGNLMAGAGTDNRFQGKANINRFGKGKQISFLGMGNNVNEQGFSIEEYLNFTGGSQRMMSGGAVQLQFGASNDNGVPMNFGNRTNGIINNAGSGVNINHQLSPKCEVNGSYFFNYLDHAKDQSTIRENFLANNNFTFNQNSKQRNNNANHRVNFTYDQKIDSVNSVKVTTNLSYNDTDSDVANWSETIASDGMLKNQSTQHAIVSGAATILNTSLLLRHKFKKKGRTISTNLQIGYSNESRDGHLGATNHFFQPHDSIVNIDQDNFQRTTYNSYGATLSYTEPLGNRKYLEGNYNFRQNLNDVNREVFDYTTGEKVFNDQLSTSYNSTYQYHRAGLNFRIARDNYNLVLGPSIQKTTLFGNVELAQNINLSFHNILPSLHFSYEVTSTGRLNFDYETSVQEPNVQQLQPVIDNSDPLNLYTGNPDLQPAYAQSWRFSFRTFNPLSFISFFSFFDIDHTSNAIVNAQNIDENLVRITQPVNVNNNLTVNSNANVGFPIKKINSRFSVGASYRNNRSIALLNDIENSIDQHVAGGVFTYTYHYKDYVDLNLTADLERQVTNYEFNQPDQVFLNSIYTAETNVSFLKNFQLHSIFEYLNYEDKATGFSQAIPLLNISVSRYMLKNNSGELKVSVNNLMNKTLGINQSSTVNYIERQTTNSLSRYFMLTFTYALNKQLDPMRSRGGHRTRMIR